MRRLAVVTATHVHRQLFGRVRGHAALAPAEQRAAGPALPDLVADDMAEQTACADDAMAEEERCRASGRRRQRRARAPAGADVPGGTAAGAAAAGGGEGGEGDPGQGGLGASGRAATLQHFPRQRSRSFNAEHTHTLERSMGTDGSVTDTRVALARWHRYRSAGHR